MPGRAAAADPEFPRLYYKAADRAAGSVTMHGDGASLVPADRGFLLCLQRQALQYFLDNQVPSGLILDRQHNHGPPRPKGLCSTAATGMGLIALALASTAPYRLVGRRLAVLRIRGIVRSSNSPIADFAEALVAKLLNLSIVAGSNASYDAVAADGKRYQIKARRVTNANPSRQLSAIRNLDKGGFDFLVAVVFDESGFKPIEVWRFPIDLVREHAKYRSHVNAHILFVSGAILADARSERLV